MAAVVGLAHIVDGAYARVVQRGGGTGLLLEPTDPTFVFCEFWRKDLERYLAAMLLRVFAEEDFAHSTLAQPFENAIMGNRVGGVARIF